MNEVNQLGQYIPLKFQLDTVEEDLEAFLVELEVPKLQGYQSDLDVYQSSSEI